MSDTLVPADFQSLDKPLVLDVKVGDKDISIELNVESVSPHPAHRYRAEPFSMIHVSSTGVWIPFIGLVS